MLASRSTHVGASLMVGRAARPPDRGGGGAASGGAAGSGATSGGCVAAGFAGFVSMGNSGSACRSTHHWC